MSAPALPATAAALDRAVTQAVDAAARRHAAALEAALSRLQVADPGHVRRLLGAVVRPVLEHLHPDGVDGDDLVALLEEVLAGAGYLQPRTGQDEPLIDEIGLAVVLTGAFGIEIAPREELPRALTDQEVVDHAVVLLGHLVAAGDADAATGRSLRPYLDAAWTELAREDLEG